MDAEDETAGDVRAVALSERPLRVLYVAGTFPPSKEYGGPTESNYELCRHLKAAGAEVRVFAIRADGDRNLPVETDCWTMYEGLPVFYASRIGRTLIAPRLYAGHGAVWRRSDVVHVCGGFSILLPVATYYCVRYRRPLVFSSRGSLLPQALERRALRKAVYNRMIGAACYARVALWHASSPEEERALQRWAGRAPVVCIPNGVSLPRRAEWPPPKGSDPGDGARYLLFLGRIHPYKRVDRIIEAFAAGAAGTDVELWIAGEGVQAYLEELTGRAAALCPSRVRFVGYVSGERKSALLARAEGLVLASRAESFGISVAEALANGTPCVVTRTAPWAGLETHGCGFWVDDSLEALALGIRSVLSLTPSERTAMGASGRAWMEREFSWANIARRMLEAYRSVVDRNA